MATNDNFRMVPASQLREVGKITGGGEVTLDRDIQFERHCAGQGLDPQAWLKAIRDTQARLRRSAMFEAMRAASVDSSGVGETRRP